MMKYSIVNIRMSGRKFIRFDLVLLVFCVKVLEMNGMLVFL